MCQQCLNMIFTLTFPSIAYHLPFFFPYHLKVYFRCFGVSVAHELRQYMDRQRFLCRDHSNAEPMPEALAGGHLADDPGPVHHSLDQAVSCWPTHRPQRDIQTFPLFLKRPDPINKVKIFDQNTGDWDSPELRLFYSSPGVRFAFFQCSKHKSLFLAILVQSHLFLPPF